MGAAFPVFLFQIHDKYTYISSLRFSISNTDMIAFPRLEIFQIAPKLLNKFLII
jgi:hypothetical protein